MGNVTDMVLTSVFGAPVELRQRFAELIIPPPTEYPSLRPDTLRYAYGLSNKGVDATETILWIATLPWTRRQAESVLHVLWTNDYASEDDSYAGRERPYKWTLVFITIPSDRMLADEPARIRVHDG